MRESKRERGSEHKREREQERGREKERVCEIEGERCWFYQDLPTQQPGFNQHLALTSSKN